MARKQKLTLKSRQQLAALRSPARQELLGHLVVVDTASVAELAERMGRSVDGLYYHLKLLEAAGLVKCDESGSGDGGRRYQVVAERFALPKITDQESRRAAVSALESSLKLTLKEFCTALADTPLKRSGSARNLFGARMRARLSKQALAQVNAHLDAIEELVVSERSKGDQLSGEFFSLTLALVPAPVERSSRNE